MLEVTWEGAATARVAQSWPLRVLTTLMLLIALIALTLLKAAPSDFGAGSKKPQQYLLQLFPSRLPGAALLMELGCPRGDGDKVKAHPDMVPTGAALRFGSQTLKPLCSSKQLWGNKSS